MSSVLKRLLRKTTAPREGFTLIEMVVVLAIIALLMLIVVPNLNHQREVAVTHSDQALQQVIQNQAEIYANDTNSKLTDVTIAKLKEKGYLNQQQVDQANKRQLKIVIPDVKTDATS